MNLLIAGSRTIHDYDRIRHDIVSMLKRHPDLTIVTGMARDGPDDIAYHIARYDLMLPYIDIPAEWDKHGKKAGMLRNGQLVAECTCGLLYWDGVSSGTQNTIGRLEKTNKPYRVRTMAAEPPPYDIFEIDDAA